MKLGLKSMVLIGVMGVALVGGVGSALALARTGANAAGNTGAFDQAVYLYWGHGATSASIDNVEDLSPSVPQYRGLTVSPQSTKTVAGNVQISFELEKTAGDHHIKGLTVSVYKIDTAFDAGTVETQILGKVAAPVLNESNLTGSTNLAVAASESPHETIGYYAIKVEWSGASDLDNPGYTLDCGITISQNFVAA